MPAHRKQFCLHGHDTHICGRLASGQCKACRNEYFKQYRKNPKIRALGKIYQRASRLRKKVAFVEACEAEASLRVNGRQQVTWVWLLPH